jgi:hypothetical protein
MTQLTRRSFEPDLLEEVSLALPVGVVLPYVGHATPDEFLFCNGQAVSRTTYASLFQVIGTYYGAGDASTTFNVPDLRGRGIVGDRVMGATDSNNQCGNSALLGIDAYHDPAPTVLGRAAGQDLCFNFIIKVKASFPDRANAYPTAPAP